MAGATEWPRCDVVVLGTGYEAVNKTSAALHFGRAALAGSRQLVGEAEPSGAWLLPGDAARLCLAEWSWVGAGHRLWRGQGVAPATSQGQGETARPPSSFSALIPPLKAPDLWAKVTAPAAPGTCDRQSAARLEQPAQSGHCAKQAALCAKPRLLPGLQAPEAPIHRVPRLGGGI